MLTALTLISAALLLAAGPDQALQPWAAKAEPSDVAKRHVEEIAAGEYKYTVVHGGTMDGANCRSPMGCGMHSASESPPSGLPARWGHSNVQRL